MEDLREKRNAGDMKIVGIKDSTALHHWRSSFHFVSDVLYLFIIQLFFPASTILTDLYECGCK